MPGSVTREDQAHMARAVELGRKGWGWVHPNPMVGCVIVRDGEVVGEGWHEAYGGAHAEVNALARAGERSAGATAYVSLEPCKHYGKTPPCVEALAAAGIVRVVFGASDPGPESGGGGAELAKRGMVVQGPVLEPLEARRENPAFFHHHEGGGTYLALKVAQTLDGKIAAAPGVRTAITGPEALREAHRLRAGFDAVMVGRGTVEADDPLLTVREGVGCRREPTRILLDSDAGTRTDARVFQDVERAPVLVFTAPDVPETSVRALERAGAGVHPVPRGADGLSLEAVLCTCGKLGIRSVLCEGGARLGGSLLGARMARRLYLFVAPFVLGEGALPAFSSGEGAAPGEGWEPSLPPRLLGRDVLLTYDRRT